MEGRISSIQSLGAVDGPGLRYVVFLQGCPLRCKYCHNPETWERSGGTVRTAQDLAETIQHYHPYFGDNGGVTVSGGEPLLQPEFVAELFRLLHRYGIHTALDTSGTGDLTRAEAVLQHTDLVLCDVKFPTEEGYKQHCGGSLTHTLDFLQLTERMDIPVWVRHVVAPGLTDTPQSMRAIRAICARFSNIEKIEWLPFKNICISKYENLGIEFPMAGKPAFSQKHIDMLLDAL